MAGSFAFGGRTHGWLFRLRGQNRRSTSERIAGDGAGYLGLALADLPGGPIRRAGPITSQLASVDPTAYPDDALAPHEELILQLHPHWWYIAKAAMALVVTVIGLAILAEVVWFVERLVRWTSIFFVLTSDRVMPARTSSPSAASRSRSLASTR